METPVLTKKAFAEIQRYVRTHSGINLTEQKKSLVIARLQKLLQINGFADFESYLQFLTNDRSGQGLSTLINKISTNHTYFNREAEHFDFLREQALPALNHIVKNANSKEKLRLWSAGCSTGEEAYQLAMELIEFFGRAAAKQKTAILATDISTDALTRALEGRYVKENVLNLPPKFVRKYFIQKDEQNFELKPFVKSLILFKRLNLIRRHFPFQKRFHIIFCRNVMIYFDQATKSALLQKFHHYLEPGGYLLIGHSESLLPDNRLFKYLQPSIYQKEV